MSPLHFLFVLKNKAGKCQHNKNICEEEKALLSEDLQKSKPNKIKDTEATIERNTLTLNSRIIFSIVTERYRY